MRVCLISVEIFAWGKYGGFGRATRVIGRELVKRGVEVFAVVPRRAGQGRVETLDGITVLGFNPKAPLSAAELLRQCDADVYHSQEPSLATHLARRAMPSRKHVVTLRDPRELGDWLTELRYPSLSRLRVVANYLYEDNVLVRRAVRRADRLYCAADFLGPKVARKYHLSVEPGLLPTPVVVPDAVPKADRPTVCYLARWARRKRPELFLELARQFPEVRFIAIGSSLDTALDRRLRARYAGLPNLEMTGHLDPFGSTQLSDVLSQSWIMVNTASREGLPNAFLEAGAHGCAVLSAVDPGGFTSRFGLRVKGDDFAGGLRTLLQGERWRERGERARAYVKATYELELAIDKHLDVYRELLSVGKAEKPRSSGRTSRPTDRPVST